MAPWPEHLHKQWRKFSFLVSGKLHNVLHVLEKTLFISRGFIRGNMSDEKMGVPLKNNRAKIKNVPKRDT